MNILEHLRHLCSLLVKCHRRCSLRSSGRSKMPSQILHKTEAISYSKYYQYTSQYHNNFFVHSTLFIYMKVSVEERDPQTSSIVLNINCMENGTMRRGTSYSSIGRGNTKISLRELSKIPVVSCNRICNLCASDVYWIEASCIVLWFP
jgi:hypothetical protein